MKTANCFIYDLHKDIQSEAVTAIARSHLQTSRSTVIFDPDNYTNKNTNFALDRHRLNEKELLLFAEMATKIRERFKLDQSLITSYEEGNRDKLTLAEIDRKVKLRRNHTKLSELA